MKVILSIIFNSCMYTLNVLSHFVGMQMYERKFSSVKRMTIFILNYDENKLCVFHVNESEDLSCWASRPNAIL